MGATNPADAAQGTIRADFAQTVDENAVHGSDGPDTAAVEIEFFFGHDGVCHEPVVVPEKQRGQTRCFRYKSDSRLIAEELR